MRVHPQERVLDARAISQREGSILTSSRVADGEAPVTDAGVAEGEDEEAVTADLQMVEVGGLFKSRDGLELELAGCPLVEGDDV